MKLVNGVKVFSELGEILSPSHTALLVVDMQNDGCLPEGWMARQGRDVSRITAMIPTLQRLLGAARTAGVKVVFVQQTTLPDNGSDPPAWLYFKTRDGRTRTDYMLDGTWGHELLECLEPRPGEVRVKKHRPSAFHLTALDPLLKSAGVRSVVVCGTITQGCVLATTLDASFHDYYTVVAEDCTQSYSQELHETALAFLRSRYDVVSAEAIVREGGWS